MHKKDKIVNIHVGGQNINWGMSVNVETRLKGFVGRFYLLSLPCKVSKISGIRHGKVMEKR